MLTHTIDSNTDSATPARPTRVVDVDEWLNRGTSVRGFTPDLLGYVPRHRLEADAS